MNNCGQQSIKDFVFSRNQEKRMFTPGPGALLVENITGLQSAFGRGDASYDQNWKSIHNFLQTLIGKTKVTSLQGSATLAIEIAVANFVSGRVLVVDSGYYSERLLKICKAWKIMTGDIQQVDAVGWENIGQCIGSDYDWIVATSVETGLGLKVPLQAVENLASKAKCRVLLDITASVGFDDDCQFADVLAFSSCKGLFGFTGAAFIATDLARENEIPSHYLNIETHDERGVTGPYHTLGSMINVIDKFDVIRNRVFENKRRFIHDYEQSLVYPLELQATISTRIHGSINLRDEQVAVLYQPRGLGMEATSTLCHLVELDRSSLDQGDALGLLNISASRR